MPFPLIAIATLSALGAGVGLQAYDTFNKQDPITVQTFKQKTPTTTAQPSANLLPLVALGAAAIIVMALVIK